MAGKNFFKELKRRNVYRVGITYAVVSWILIQIVSVITPMLEVPLWLGKVILIFLLVGFPVALILAWAFEMSPEGIIRTTAQDEGEYPVVEKSKPIINNLVIGILLVFIIGQFTYIKFFANAPDAMEVAPPANLIAERIAVVPFANLTGDPGLDNLGMVAADWINQGFMEIDGAEVVSNFTIQSHMASIGIMDNDPQGRTSFAQLTGARNLITGNYYLEDNKLVFKLEIVDAARGDLHFSFNTITGSPDDKEGLINELREKVTGYWVARDMVDARFIKPPKYEAYQLYMEARLGRMTVEKLDEILSIDSTFYLPRISYLAWNLGGRYGMTQRHFEFFKRHEEFLSTYESLTLSFYDHIFLGNKQQAFAVINGIRLKFPYDFILNQRTAAFVLHQLNNPQLTLDIYNELPISNIVENNFGVAFNLRIQNTVICLVRLNRIREMETFLENIEPNSDASLIPYLYVRIIGGAVLNNRDKIEDSYSRLSMIRNQDTFFYLNYLGILSRSNLIPEWLRARIQSDLVNFYNQLKQLDQGQLTYRNYEALITKDPSKLHLDSMDTLSNFVPVLNLSLAGRTFFTVGQLDRVDDIIEQLKTTLSNPTMARPTSGNAGYAHYAIGQLYVMTGAPDQAVIHIAEARKLGFPTLLSFYEYDYLLTPLFERDDFKEVIKPEWPKLEG